MGSAASAATPPPPPPPTQSHMAPPPYGAGLPGILPPKPDGDEKKEEKVDYLNLPCPVPYEEIQREALNLENVPMAQISLPDGASFTKSIFQEQLQA